MIELLPLQDSGREQFVRDNQEAFRYGAMEEFGLRDSRFEEPGEIISRATILKSMDNPHSQTYRIVVDGVVAGGIVLILDEARREGGLIFSSSRRRCTVAASARLSGARSRRCIHR